MACGWQGASVPCAPGFDQHPNGAHGVKRHTLPKSPRTSVASPPMLCHAFRRVNENESTRHPPLKPPLQGRLNSFQRTMLDWNDLHPYNAVHVVRISAAPDLTRLHDAIRDTLALHGLTSLTLNRKRGTFQYDGRPARYEIKVIDAGENPQEMLRAEIESQVNTGFDITGPFQPFRFFVIREMESFCLGLVYFHAVADAVSIVQLLKHIYETQLGGSPPPGAKCFRLARHGFGFKPLVLTRQLAGFWQQLRQQRRSVRVVHRDANDGRNRFEQLTLAPEMLRALSAAAKAWDVTINDVFLAVLLVCCSPFALNRFKEPPRSRIAIGCIVNTRGDLDLEDPEGWGLFLGSFVVNHETPDGIRLPELARDIRRQTQAIKQRKAYAGPPLELALGRFLLSFFSTEHRTKLYQKHYPLWGGITNMNLNSLWPQPPPDIAPVFSLSSPEGGEGRGEEANCFRLKFPSPRPAPRLGGERETAAVCGCAPWPPPADYFRGVSTGPVTPLVLSVTTVRDVVNLGLTFRATTFTDAHIRQVKKHFLQTLEQVKLCA